MIKTSMPFKIEGHPLTCHCSQRRSASVGGKRLEDTTVKARLGLRGSEGAEDTDK